MMNYHYACTYSYVNKLLITFCYFIVMRQRQAPALHLIYFVDRNVDEQACGADSVALLVA